MRAEKNKGLVRSKIIRLGPICIKRYGAHKRVPDIPAITRLRREIVGANLLNSQHVIVARPLVWSESGIWIIRRWHPGVHPDKHHRPTESGIYALAHWLKEHRAIGCSVPFRTNVNVAIRIRFIMMGIQNLDDPLIKAILERKDLLHADLIPENILLGNKKPIILDSEAVSVGHLAWDAAQVLTFILRVDKDDQIASEFLDEIGFEGVDRELVWTLVNLFKES